MMLKDALPLAEASELLPKPNGRRISIQTLKRWILKGCRGVKLNGFKIGGVWYTSPEALEQFQADCTNMAGVELRITPAELRDETKRAREELTRKGFYGQCCERPDEA